MYYFKEGHIYFARPNIPNPQRKIRFLLGNMCPILTLYLDIFPFIIKSKEWKDKIRFVVDKPQGGFEAHIFWIDLT